MNNPAAVDRVGNSRCTSSPLVAGNHVISAQNRSNILRIIQFVSVLTALATLWIWCASFALQRWYSLDMWLTSATLYCLQAQNVNLAMDASRKSRVALAASIENLGEDQQQGEGVLSIKSTLDYNFQDLEGLLRLVKLAMQANNRWKTSWNEAAFFFVKWEEERGKIIICCLAALLAFWTFVSDPIIILYKSMKSSAYRVCYEGTWQLTPSDASLILLRKPSSPANYPRTMYGVCIQSNQGVTCGTGFSISRSQDRESRSPSIRSVSGP